MEVGKYDIKIIRGVTFTETFEISLGGVPINFTAYTVQARLHPTKFASDTILMSGSGFNGGLTVLVASSVTSLFAWDQGDWDLQTTDVSGKVDRWLEGLATVRD